MHQNYYKLTTLTIQKGNVQNFGLAYENRDQMYTMKINMQSQSQSNNSAHFQCNH